MRKVSLFILLTLLLEVTFINKGVHEVFYSVDEIMHSDHDEHTDALTKDSNERISNTLHLNSKFYFEKKQVSFNLFILPRVSIEIVVKEVVTFTINFMIKKEHLFLVLKSRLASTIVKS